VILSQIADVIVVPNRFIKTDAATRQAAVTVETAPGIYQAVPVTLGLRNTAESQVVGGLQVGQTIVILPDASQANTQNGFGFFRVPGGGPPPGGGNFGGGGGRGGG
jgi:macrolide-specific efflux system membrane fusion protein